METERSINTEILRLKNKVRFLQQRAWVMDLESFTDRWRESFSVTCEDIQNSTSFTFIFETGVSKFYRSDVDLLYRVKK